MVNRVLVEMLRFDIMLVIISVIQLGMRHMVALVLNFAVVILITAIAVLIGSLFPHKLRVVSSLRAVNSMLVEVSWLHVMSVIVGVVQLRVGHMVTLVLNFAFVILITAIAMLIRSHISAVL